jgi:hypothetical protein
LVQIAAFLAVLATSRHHAGEQGSDELRLDAPVFELFLQLRGERRLTKAHIVAGESAFQQRVATQNANVLKSELANYVGLTKADLVMLVSARRRNAICSAVCGAVFVPPR